MYKFLSQIRGAKVLLFQERAVIGVINKAIIDPDRAEIVGFEILSHHTKDYSYIPPLEIKGYGEGIVLVEDIDSLCASGDVVKIKDALPRSPKIIGQKVIDENGLRMGRVEDATIDLKSSLLNKLYVNDIFPLNILGTDKIITRKQIVSIDQKRIVVSGTGLKKPSAAILTKENLATD